MKFAITKKIGMSRIFDENGKHVAVTLLAGEEGVISRIKSTANADGYDAIVVEIKAAKEGKKSKFHEFRVDAVSDYKIGMEINVAQFVANDEVTVSATAKGKGFAGTIKRHGFHRGPVSHGSHNVRQPGSIGGGYPQRVLPGRQMPGRLGGRNSIVRNLKVVSVDTKEGIIAISGAVPGPNRRTVKLICK